MALLDRPSLGAQYPTAGPGHRAIPNRLRLLGQGSVLVAAFVIAGILFLGMPAGTASLPDPAMMRLVGRAHNTSAENVAFWSARVAQNPTSSPALVQLASAQLALAGDTADLTGYETAQATAERAVASTPDDSSALLTLARTRAGQHDFAGALALAEQVLAANPVSTGALLAAGDAHLELGEYRSARTYYDQVAAVTGGVAPVVSRYARLEAITGSIDEAASLARQALVDAGDIDLRAPDAAFYWFQLASFEFATGDPGAARRHLGSALSIDPQHPGSRELLAKTLVALGDEPAAIALYEELVDGGGAADLHGALAMLYDRAGRADEAAAERAIGLTIAYESADRFPAERRHLIGFLADNDPQQALRLAELDLAERQDVFSHAWYAWALFNAGRVDEAAEAIEPALAYGTQDAWLLYQAGSIKAAAGETEAARRLLQSALDLNPFFDIGHAAEAERLLDSLS